MTSATARTPTILLVEDEAPLRELLEYMLRNAGYVVESADNGRVALDRLKDRVVDLIVTDLCMPDIDGVELVMHLRKSPVRIPIIAISGGILGSTAEILRTVSLLGARATLAKPFSMRQLLDAVRDCVGPASGTTIVHEANA